MITTSQKFGDIGIFILSQSVPTLVTNHDITALIFISFNNDFQAGKLGMTFTMKIIYSTWCISFKVLRTINWFCPVRRGLRSLNHSLCDKMTQGLYTSFLQNIMISCLFLFSIFMWRKIHLVLHWLCVTLTRITSDFDDFIFRPFDEYSGDLQ